MRRLLRLMLVAFTLLPVSALAQWTPDGAMLTAVGGSGVSIAQSIPDGAGGAIIAWMDKRGTVAYDIYAQRINDQGVPLWTANGAPICVAANDQNSPVLVADAGGGAIIAWYDLRSGVEDIYAQRINASGVVQWAANGVAVCTAAGTQWYPEIVADAAGGAIITWSDRRSGTNFDVYAQRVNATGVAQWVGNGVILCTDGTDQALPRATADGAGGAIVTWTDYRFGISDLDIFAQRVNAAGTIQWGASGEFVCGAALNQDYHQIVSDGAGGAIIAWGDFRNSINYDIYAQRMGPTGSPLWASGGVLLCAASGNQAAPFMAADGAGGATVVWGDYRSSVTSDVYAQRVNSLGASLWEINGVPVSVAAGHQTDPAVASDGAGGCVVSWVDYDSSPDAMFAQRVTASGTLLWSTNGMAVSSERSAKLVPVNVSAGGGTIVVWAGYRTGIYQLYAQRIDNVHGFWGHPEPTITAVKDIPHDQGGKVAVNWSASGRDLSNPRTIDFYSMWRAVDMIPLGATTISSGDLSTLGADDQDPIYLATPSRYYERVGTQTAQGWPGYSFAAATRADSVAGATANTYFMVAAHYVYDNFVAFASNEVSGHSVDNLAPAAPLFLIAQRVGADVQLRWNGVRMSDLRDYSVYRATSSGVTPVPINFFASSDDTVAVDPNAPASALYYIVTAYDVHANQSAPSNEASVQPTTGIGDAPALTVLTVLQNHPNPFNATTDLNIGLPSNSDVSVDVFDVAGRRVSAIEVNGAKAGWNRIPFAARDERGNSLASGVYFYRVKAAGSTITKKMVIAR